MNQARLSPKRRRIFRASAACLLLAALSPIVLARVARATKHQDPWEHAIALREQLAASPAEQRTNDQYEDVLNAFRLIYHGDPGAPKAPAAVAAVADLLAEKGRVLKDQRALRSAIGQYEFLRQQYPNSPQVENALLLEGEICRQDLKDAACGEEKFRAVIAAMPGSSFAEEAALELKEMQQKEAADAKNSKVARADSTPAPPDSKKKNKISSVPVMALPDQAQQAPAPVAELPRPGSSAELSQPHRVVPITGMRHWSNPTSTRIAIDLGGKVEYEASRVPNPDRIFFDLHGARLASSLNGHQVEVIDDGFLKRIRAAQFQPDVTRVVLDVTDVSQYSAFLLPNPWRLIIDIHGSKSPASLPTISAQLPAIQGASSSKTGSRRGSDTALTSDSTIADIAKLSSEPARVQATAGPTSEPVSAQVATPSPDLTANRSPVAQTGKSRKKLKDAPSSSVDSAGMRQPALPHAADPTSDGQRSLVRALGLKVGRIVIDAGHGGHDSGTLGPGGIEEKDVVLDVALRTGKLLQKRLGAEIVYTREDDTFIPLETRTAIANKAQADLFLSIHGNSSSEPSARGVETYYLNFTADPNALEVAARENAVSSHSVHQLSDLVRKITLKDKIDESREFAADVDQGLYSGLRAGNPGLKNRGVKKAPFVVLIGAQMPSILAEISFLTNPDDAEQLLQGSYRQRIAEALVSGVERYLHGLSGTEPTAKTPARSSARNLATAEEPAGQ